MTMASSGRIIGLVAAFICIHNSDAMFSPNVTVRSCSSHEVVISLENAAEGGLIYIQGRTSACQRTTQPQLTHHAFNFDTCNIKYDSKFRVIIQKNPHYQTGNDKVIPVMCLVDTSDLFVTGVVYPEEVFDASVNHTVRPSAKMRVFTDSMDVSGGEVTLNDKVRMSLTLDDPYLDTFDIKVKDCMASVIPLIQQECSPDQELFPNFEHRSHGDLESTFQAFQPTNLAGYPEVDVAFTCSVAVCKDECRKAICGGRKRRDSDDDDDVVERVTVGTTLRVKSANMEPQALSGEVCAEKIVVASVAVVAILTLVASWCICGCIISKFRLLRQGMHDGPSKQSKLRRMSEMNINMARAVGRRLSSMLNIPGTGYDMNKTGMMEEIPEMDRTPPSKRRESVTVTKVEFIDQ